MKPSALFSPEALKNWEKKGRAEFMKQCIKVIKDEDKSVALDKDGKKSVVVNNINDLILNGVRGTLKKELVVTTLQELVTLHNDIPSIILDSLNIADAETLSDVHGEQSSAERANFCYIVKECENFLSDKLLKERLEIDTLQEVGILKNRNFYTKFIKVKTKLYYKQRKFNLFREESEGFAKLVTELNKTFSKETTYERLLDIVQSLIGCFNLDPNRVLDLILESFENKPEDAKLFVPLVRAYMSDPKTICEVLGSKFTQQRNEPLTCKGLYILTAQLLQHEIIKLEDIYIWLSMEDKIIQKDCEKDLKDAKEYVRKLQIISTNNKEKEETADDKENLLEKYNANQKLGLCEALINVGDWKNAKLLIERLPEHYAVEHQPIALALCQLLHHIIDPVYRKYWKLSNRQTVTSAPSTSTSMPSTATKKPSFATLYLDNPLRPQQAQTLEELTTYATPIFLKLGAALRYDTVLLYKLVRIGRITLQIGPGCQGEEGSNVSLTSTSSHAPLPVANTSSPLYYTLITILDTTIFPSLSYLDCNCAVAEEIWSVVKLYPYQTRYCLYSRWKNDTQSVYSELLRKRADAEKQIKNIMKRVSKENIKQVGRYIGKLTHSSPGFVFDYILLQIQVFDNLIHPVVDSLKYLTNLSYDVLGYCLVESLANADKNRVKHDSTSISHWLQSLSSFCGAIFKKYNIELTGLLQYVANQLKAQKSLDLLILKEIVQKMAGIEAAEDLTLEQLSAMSGGELLKVEAGYFSQVRNTKKSSLRLKEAMADQNLAVALCLLMAQQKYCVVYRETQKSHLKLVGKLSDQCQDTLVQFGTFLGSTFSVDEYVKKLPSIETMLLEYHIPNEVAFFLARPMFNHAITKKYDELRKEDPNYKKMSTASKQQKYYEAVSAIMTPVHASVIPLHPSNIWEDIAPQLISTFWSLTMYDLHVPEDTYMQAISKIKQQSIAHMDSGGASSKSKKEQDRYLTLMEKLQEERRKQQEHVDKVLFRLKQEKDTWFLQRSAKTAKNDTITRFLQLCIFPRCTFTAIDAVFCAKFVHTLHSLQTQNFSTLLCYDRLFCDITYSVTSCTENEAMRYGRFLYSMLDTIMHWHKSKDIFDKECSQYPGFMTKYRVNNQYCNNHDQVNYENYRHVCHKWHYKLTKALTTCIESRDYVQIRNALIVLIKLIPFFPAITKLAQIIEKKVIVMRDDEKNKRQDLYTLAVSYLGQLKQKVQSGQTVEEDAFHIMTSKSNRVDNSNANSVVSKQNGDANVKETAETKETQDKVKSETRKANKPSNSEDVKPVVKLGNADNPSADKQNAAEKEKSSSREESRERQSRRDEKRDESSDREKRRDRKDDKQTTKDDRQYREERFVETVQKSPNEEANPRYSSDRERYYDERGGHYYREVRDERDVGTSNGSGTFLKHPVETEPERDVKRRKTDNQTAKNYSKQLTSEDRKPSQTQIQQDYVVTSSSTSADKSAEKKERTTKLKEKQREKYSEDEKELRKEKKITRKRDRGEEAILQAEHKKRRDEDKAMVKLMHQNGEMVESPHARDTREKPHHAREKSPYLRERSHDRVELRDKQLEDRLKVKEDDFLSKHR